MNTTKTAVLTVLVLVNVAFVLGWIRAARRHGLRERPTLGDVAIGVVTDFLDTLGIGSFAPTTALFKFRGRPADELIPGTLNVGHNARAFLETTLFVTSVAVEPLLLGMHPLAAFPIMMASDGILQPVASLGFFRSGRFAHGPSLGLLAGGVVGVLIAFPLVSKLPLYWLRWLVVAVVTYAALSMLRSAYTEARAAAPAAAVERG